MSEGTGEQEAIELPPQPDQAFASLMDLLVEAEPGAAAAAGGEAAAAAGAGGGDAGAAGAGAGDQAAAGAGAAPGAVGADGTLQLPTAGDQPAGDAAAGAAAGHDRAGAADGAKGGTAAGGAGADAVGGGAAGLPASWTLDAATIAPQLGELSTKLEEKVASEFQQAALAEVREEHGNYFEALEKHPRLLVGTQVPAIGKEGFETIQDTNDAREWQEAVKGLLVEEVRDRAGRALEADSTVLNTLHQSIELFQKNTDLIPGTKSFDVELANRFATLVKPYEHRVEGKLHGYSIPVQPIIDQLRAQVTSERAAAPAPPGTPASGAAASKPAAPAKPAAEPPQAGISSQAGSAGEDKEEFSTLFGTIGLPNLRI